MKILQVVEASGAGVSRHVRVLCEDLIALDHQLTVAYSPHRADDRFMKLVADRQNRIHFVPLDVRREISPVSDFGAVVRLLRLLKSEGPFDVVHGHSSKGGGLARLAGRCLGVPTVYTPHSLIMSAPTLSPVERSVYTLIERILGQWATSKIIAVSDEEREFILNLKLTPSNRVTVIENGIDVQDLEYFSDKATCEIDNSKPLTFGSIMRFSPQKAPEHLIEAFIELAKRLPQIPMRLVIAGSGELFSEAQRQVSESGLQENISLLGWRTDTREVLHQFDIFVLSSLYEGFSYAVLEAMAARLPIVSTRVFGTQGTISRVPGNVVVPVRDPAALANGMNQMATLTAPGSLRTALQKIGDANQDYVRAHFRNSDTTRRIVEVYQALRQGR